MVANVKSAHPGIMRIFRHSSLIPTAEKMLVGLIMSKLIGIIMYCPATNVARVGRASEPVRTGWEARPT